MVSMNWQNLKKLSENTSNTRSHWCWGEGEGLHEESPKRKVIPMLRERGRCGRAKMPFQHHFRVELSTMLLLLLLKIAAGTVVVTMLRIMCERAKLDY